MELNLSQHIDTTICRHCGERRVKTFGKIGSAGRSIYVDEFGERWYGKKCPKCYKEYKIKYDLERNIDKGCRPLGTTYCCVQCGKNSIVKVGATTMCKDCKLENMRDGIGK